MNITPTELAELALLRSLHELSNVEIVERMGMSGRGVKMAIKAGGLPRRANRGGTRYGVKRVRLARPRRTGYFPPWPAEKRDRLIAEYLDCGDESLAALARRFDVTKNAAIGQLYRAGMIGLPKAADPLPQIEYPPADHCMWPYDDPDQAGFHYCGMHAIPGKPYCLEHAAIAYIRPREERQAA